MVWVQGGVERRIGEARGQMQVCGNQGQRGTGCAVVGDVWEVDVTGFFWMLLVLFIYLLSFRMFCFFFFFFCCFIILAFVDLLFVFFFHGKWFMEEDWVGLYFYLTGGGWMGPSYCCIWENDVRGKEVDYVYAANIPLFYRLLVCQDPRRCAVAWYSNWSPRVQHKITALMKLSLAHQIVRTQVPADSLAHRELELRGF
jgi:hypothetical protein